MLRGLCEYSEKEQRLIEHFGFQDVAQNVFPPVLYPMMAAKAFIINEQGPYADSLRRLMAAFETGKAYRLTPEWDAMIQEEG